MTPPIALTMSVSSFFRNLPDTLQQPASMSVLGSVGVHLLLFATLPALTSSPPDPEDALREVRVVTLTPEEQGRLPQAPTTSQLNLPPVPQAPNTKLNSPLMQPLPLDSTPLYRFPDLSTSTPVLPPAPTIDWSKVFPSSTRIISPPVPPLSSAPIPAPAATPPAPIASSSPTAPSPSESTSPTFPNLTPAPPLTTPGSPSAQAPSASPSTSTPQPTATTSPRPVDRLLADNRAMSELYARENFVFNSTGATDGEKRQKTTQSFQEWFKQNISDKGIADNNLDQRVIQTELPYRSPTPLTEKYDPALVYVLLDPQGKIAADPAVLGRTGYRYLDLLAEKAIAQTASELKPTGKYVIYKIELTLKPLNQPSAAPAS